MKRISGAVTLCFLLLTMSATQGADSVRASALAGKGWYPADPAELRQMVDGFLDAAVAAQRESKPPLRALILPHAGYRYSGATAAKGLALVRNRQFQRVLLLAPTHYLGFDGLSIADVDAYETPLGPVPLDRTAVQRLRRSPLVGSYPEAHRKEHSIEIELPLLQRALAPGWQLLPILVGSLSAEQYRQAADLLRPLADENTLVIVSSDFTHYGKRFRYTPFPMGDQVAEQIQALDEGALKAILSGDFEGFLSYQQATGITICGYRPIALLLRMLPPSARLTQLAYTTSGALTGDYYNSVSYAVVAVSAPEPLSEDDRAGPSALLSHQDLALLHRFALAGIEEAVLGPDDARSERLERIKEDLPMELKQPAGAFVTLKENGRLRGCIGYISPRQPLYQAVLESGYNAACRDHRFQPLEAAELKGLEVEVSVLTPPRPIPSYESFRVGEQGIILSKDGLRAVFLPEVAREQGWDRVETLSHLARKAGLEPDAWRKGASFEVFESQKYSAPYSLKFRSSLPPLPQGEGWGEGI